VIASSAGTFSCVIDEDPRFHLEALRWYASLTSVAGVDPSDLVVHVVGPTDSDALEVLRARGVTVRPVAAYDARSPHCNKVAGALALASAGVDGHAVLTDADTVFCEDPRALDLRGDCVASKTVDAPNPPLDVLASIFDRADVELPPIVPLDFDPGLETVEGNSNGGLYLVPGHLLEQVATAWDRWARWMLEHVELLGPHAVFVDQVAMALALRDDGIADERLGPRWNLPTHVPGWLPDDVEAPASIHYHDRVTTTGLIATTGNSQVDERIAMCNAAAVELWDDAFPNRTFWEWRYRVNPELGSGVGSRGIPLSDKRALLVEVMTRIRPESTLDVGCGDGEATRGIAIPDYVGVDSSAAAVDLARAARPGDTFLVGTLADHQRGADLTICLDVLIHQSDPAIYQDIVRRLLLSARKALMVSGYESAPTGDPTMTYFHESLSTTVRALAPKARLSKLRVEHEITTWLVETGTRPVWRRGTRPIVRSWWTSLARGRSTPPIPS
jgi:SAM-dependent methyltransferase